MTPLDMKDCRVCHGAHYFDHTRFCWTNNSGTRPIKPTKKEVRMLAQRNVQTTIVHTR